MFIEVKGARKQYGTGEAAVYALDGIDFTLDEGKICVILGPSGSGKSTLLNMIGGLDSLDSGEISISGAKITGLSKKALTAYRKESVGFVFQFYNLIPDLTVEENMAVVAEIAKNPLSVDDILKALDIEKYRYRFPRELSGGQQQRVAIARAMVKNPKLLLCDELTGALDTKSSRSVLKFIEKINREYGTTTLIITHNEAIAGMACAVRCAEHGVSVTLVSPFPSERSQSVMAAGGINAVLPEHDSGDSVISHIEDTLRSGNGLAGQKAVSGLCEHAGEIIRYLEKIGTVFSVDSSGRLARRAFGGQSYQRTYYCGSSTGKQIVSALVMEVRRYEAAGLIRRRLWSCFHSALIRDGVCYGALLFDEKSGRLEPVYADALVMRDLFEGSQRRRHHDSASQKVSRDQRSAGGQVFHSGKSHADQSVYRGISA